MITFLVPVTCEYLPMVGIKHLLNTIENIQPLNAKLRNLGYMLTMVDRREGITDDVEEVLRKNFQKEVFKNRDPCQYKIKGLSSEKDNHI